MTFSGKCASIVFFLVSLFCGAVHAQSTVLTDLTRLKAPSVNRWVDSIFAKLSLEEKIGQLFMVAAFSNRGEAETARISEVITSYHIGGVLFLRGGPGRQYAMTQRFQSLSRVPLLVAMDAENGLGMRLDSALSFPREMALGAIRNNSLIYQMGKEIARECRTLGVNMNMAPVVDVNDNPLNPIIGERSFGEDKLNVAKKGIAYMKGLQDGHVLAVAKHFPGHGDTYEDSHLTLPLVDRSAQDLDSIELYPFRQLIENGLSGVMTAHLSVPALDPTVHLASSLSRPIVTDLLQSKLRFSGLTITDALNMNGVAKYYSPEVRDIKALLAGNDVLLFPEDISRAIKYLISAVVSGEISQTAIDRKVIKILAAKHKAGFAIENKATYSGKGRIIDSLTTSQARYMNAQLVQASLTMLGNANHLLPLKNLEEMRIAVLSIGELNGNTFQQTLNKYTKVTCFSAWKDNSDQAYDSLESALRPFNTVVIGLHNLEKSDRENYGIRGSTRDFINRLSLKKNVVLTVFGNPYVLGNFSNLSNVIVGYDDSPVAQNLSAQLIFGAIGCDATLPVTASGQFKKGDGLTVLPIGRLSFVLPEEAGIRSADLRKIDSIALDGVNKHAYPGCVVLAARNGKVFYEKAFGTHTYDDRHLITVSDLFDLASVTKISATLLGVMKLYEAQQIDLSKPLSFYLPAVSKTNKRNILLKELLAHQAGLVPFIPFYRSAMQQSGVFRPDSSAAFPSRVAENLYLRKNYFEEVMWPEALASPIKTPGQYVYSDLSMYFMRAVVEAVSRQPLENFLENDFYRPLGLPTLGYHPRWHVALDRIAPTENDRTFRKQLLVGDVHDQGAAMQGGVGGHAGLFSNAADLAVIGQLYLNGGSYGGRSYLRKQTIEIFNTRPYPATNRRGLGFDKPEIDVEKYPAIPKTASQLTFGHTGFTGTCIWVDPAYGLVYVFLSNRICPDADNTTLSSLGIRPKINAILYDAILKGQKCP